MLYNIGDVITWDNYLLSYVGGRVLNPKVSVIMPIYNNEDYLFHSINSILNQTFSDFEFIIIDDGSTDHSLETLHKFKDKRIKLIINKNNLGISKTLNIGIEHCLGEYIARMDGDDVSVNKRLEKQIYFMENNKDISICGCNMHIINKNESKSCTTNYCLLDSEIKTDMLFGKTPLAHPTIMCRRSFINDYNIRYNVDALYAEDLDLYCRCCNIAKYANIDEKLHYYRIHDSSVSIQHKTQQLNTARFVINRFLKSEGLMLTDNEFNIHCSLYLPLENNYKINEKDRITWKEKMESFIESNKKYNKTRFNDLIGIINQKMEML